MRTKIALQTTLVGCALITFLYNWTTVSRFLSDTVLSSRSPVTQQSSMHLAEASKAAATIVHIVLFAFKPEVSESTKLDVSSRMLALKHKTRHPDTNRPYILSASGGLDNSPEGLQANFTHGFVVEFKCAADRDYYVAKDPVHQAFVKSLDGIVDKALVFDYHPGVFKL
ncbi:hypothetical protein HGRIS_003550 [Hohenbuehelia grisea]|uniref:Stress-response A/B barrel domain-containing protein n=1 Tax=Hohenbuehelia grisea TaxID=104357 RepID=A0ABR3JFT5_9AGAR